jgi:hypothetical protein
MNAAAEYITGALIVALLALAVAFLWRLVQFFRSRSMRP